MNYGFIMTTTLYPLAERLPLNGCFFDNPRTPEEIRAVAKMLRMANRIDDVGFPETSKQFGKEVISLEMALDCFFEENNLDKKYILKKNGEVYQDIYYKMAKNWVVLRYMDPTDEEFLSEESYNHYKKVIAYINLLTFMSFSENAYKNHSFLIPESFDFFDIRTVDKTIRNIIVSFITVSYSLVREEDMKNFQFCPFNRLYDKFQKLEIALESLKKPDLISFIADNINAYISMDNEKIRIISLVSILELLLTHNPDFNRFNVEDSIKKQFCNKLLILLCMKNKNINYSFLEKYLLKIYDLRSSIAHGDFSKIDVHLNKIHQILVDNDEDYRRDFDEYDTEIVLEEVNSFLRNCVRLAVNEALDNPNMIEILKK